MAEIETKIEICPWRVPNCPANLPETCKVCIKGFLPLPPADIVIGEFIATRYGRPQHKPQENINLETEK